MSGTGKLSTWVAGAILLILCANPASAQSVRPIRFFAGGGIELPSGKLNDGASYGYLGTAGVAFRPAVNSSPEINIVLRATYSKFPSSTDESGDVSFRGAGVELQLDRAFNSEPNIFVVGGGGITRTEVDPHTYVSFATGVNGVEVIKQGYAEDNPYLTAGIGIQSGPLILETRLTNTFGSQTKNLTWFSVMLEITTK